VRVFLALRAPRVGRPWDRLVPRSCSSSASSVTVVCFPAGAGSESQIDPPSAASIAITRTGSRSASLKARPPASLENGLQLVQVVVVARQLRVER